MRQTGVPSRLGNVQPGYLSRGGVAANGRLWYKSHASPTSRRLEALNLSDLGTVPGCHRPPGHGLPATDQKPKREASRVSYGGRDPLGDDLSVSPRARTRTAITALQH